MASRAHLRNLGWEVAFLTGVSLGAAAQNPPTPAGTSSTNFTEPIHNQQYFPPKRVEIATGYTAIGSWTLPVSPAAPTSEALQNERRGKAILPDIQKAAGYSPSQSIGGSMVNVMELMKLSYGQWPVPGSHSDPDLLHQFPVQTENVFLAETAMHLSGQTNIHIALYRNGPPKILSDDYLAYEKAALSRAHIKTAIVSPKNYADASDAISILSHEGIHALFAHWEFFRSLILPPEKLNNIGESRMFGLGPEMEGLLALHDTPAQISERHQRLSDFQQGVFKDAAGHISQDDNDLPEYFMLKTERLPHLHQAISDPIRNGVWEKAPQNRQQLWAALYNMTKGDAAAAFRIDPRGQDEVSSFLLSKEGKKALAAFPADPTSHGKQATIEVMKKLTQDQKVGFFTAVLPQDYGELKEMEGDPDGLIKMGLPASPNYGIIFAEHLIKDRTDEATPWDAAKWEKMAEALQPAVFERLCELAVIHENPAVLKILLQTTEGSNPAHTLSAQQREQMLNDASRLSNVSPQFVEVLQVLKDAQTGGSQDLAAARSEWINVSRGGQRVPSSAAYTQQIVSK